MGTQADHDLWGQALATECRYGDHGPEVIARKVRKLRDAGEFREAEFWSRVAECLNELHAIRFPGYPNRLKRTVGTIFSLPIA